METRRVMCWHPTHTSVGLDFQAVSIDLKQQDAKQLAAASSCAMRSLCSNRQIELRNNLPTMQLSTQLHQVGKLFHISNQNAR